MVSPLTTIGKESDAWNMSPMWFVADSTLSGIWICTGGRAGRLTRRTAGGGGVAGAEGAGSTGVAEETGAATGAGVSLTAGAGCDCADACESFPEFLFGAFELAAEASGRTGSDSSCRGSRADFGDEPALADGALFTAAWRAVFPFAGGRDIWSSTFTTPAVSFAILKAS